MARDSDACWPFGRRNSLDSLEEAGAQSSQSAFSGEQQRPEVLRGKKDSPFGKYTILVTRLGIMVSAISYLGRSEKLLSVSILNSRILGYFLGCASSSSPGLSS
jgi:hypothetical protein